MGARPRTSLTVAAFWLLMAAIAHFHVLLFVVIFALLNDFAFAPSTWYLFWAAVAVAVPAAACVTCQALIRWQQFRGRRDNPKLISARYCSFLALVAGATLSATLYAFGASDGRMLLIALVLGASFVALRFHDASVPNRNQAV